MRDTLTITPPPPPTPSPLFSKNSDRKPNEAQRVALLPAVEHAPGRRRCTYVGIDTTPLHVKQIALDFFDQDR